MSKPFTPPANGKPITMGADDKLVVPDNPIVPFIEGDGTGRDIWRASVRVLDAAVEKAYGGKRRSPGTRCTPARRRTTSSTTGCPDETVEAFRTYLVGIKGPLTTPIGGGIRSLNVALRQLLDLYVCLRPVRWFQGVPSPVKRPQDVDMVIFRENTEDIYAGIEFEAESDGREEDPRLHREGVPEGLQEGPLPGHDGHRHQAGEPRGDRAPRARGDRVRARQQAEERHVRPQGQHHEVHRGRVHALGLRPRAARVRRRSRTPGTQWEKTKAAKGEDAANAEQKAALARGKILVKDAIADITLQQVLTRAKEFDVIATLNLNGDYLSDALAAQVGGIGIAPGGNINYVTGPRHLRGDARHGAEVRGPRQGEPRHRSSSAAR